MKMILNRKTIMMIAGVLAAVMIVLSQSFYQQQANEKGEKAKTEQKAEKKGETYISVPADAVAQSNIVQLDDQVPSLQKVTTAEVEHQKAPLVRAEVFAKYFKILFRAIISPNAP